MNGGRNWTRRVAAKAVVACCLWGDISAVAADGLEVLLNDNPFLPRAQPAAAKPAEPPPPYEFRGRSVENGAEYFSLYNLETKKAVWVSRGRGDLKVEAYDPQTGLVVIDQAGRTLRLALKQPPALRGGAPLAPVAAVAGLTSAPTPSPAVIPMAVSEAQRLERLAGEIQARRAQRRPRVSGG